jgi:hypothetical protein
MWTSALALYLAALVAIFLEPVLPAVDVQLFPEELPVTQARTILPPLDMDLIFAYWGEQYVVRQTRIVRFNAKALNSMIIAVDGINYFGWAPQECDAGTCTWSGIGRGMELAITVRKHGSDPYRVEGTLTHPDGGYTAILSRTQNPTMVVLKRFERWPGMRKNRSDQTEAMLPYWMAPLMPSELLFKDLAHSPPDGFTAKFNLAAMDSFVITLDDEKFIARAATKKCRPGICTWVGSSGGGGSMTLNIANDGFEGDGWVRHGGGGYTYFGVNAGEASVSRSSTAPYMVWSPGREEANARMGVRALERMAHAHAG